MEKSFYERLTEAYRRNATSRGIVRVKIYDVASTVVMYALYAFLLLTLLRGRRWVELAALVGTTGSGFLLVTVLRRVLSAPRPFEVYRFEPLLGRHRPGRSFPSRHAYSAVAISAAACVILGWQWGWLFLCVAVIQMLARVVGGVHFVRDVLAGAGIGALFGGVGFWLLLWLFR